MYLIGYSYTKQSCYSVQKERLDIGQGSNIASVDKLMIELSSKDIPGDSGKIRFQWHSRFSRQITETGGKEMWSGKRV